MANVLGVVAGEALKPFAKVSGSEGLFSTLNVFESGGCWAI